MTREQIISAVGESNVVPLKDDVFLLKTVPLPNADVESYLCTISPSRGLLQISATISVDSNDKGEELQAKFKELREILEEKYGTPSLVEDGAVSSMRQKDRPELYMKNLSSGQRKLAAVWTWVTRGNNYDLELIYLNAGVYPDGKTGMISLIYNFKGMKEFQDSKKAAKDSTY